MLLLDFCNLTTPFFQKKESWIYFNFLYVLLLLITGQGNDLFFRKCFDWSSYHSFL